jgi:hypothetical protein
MREAYQVLCPRHSEIRPTDSKPGLVSRPYREYCPIVEDV